MYCLFLRDEANWIIKKRLASWLVGWFDRGRCSTLLKQRKQQMCFFSCEQDGVWEQGKGGHEETTGGPLCVIWTLQDGILRCYVEVVDVPKILASDVETGEKMKEDETTSWFLQLHCSRHKRYGHVSHDRQCGKVKPSSMWSDGLLHRFRLVVYPPQSGQIIATSPQNVPEEGKSPYFREI